MEDKPTKELRFVERFETIQRDSKGESVVGTMIKYLQQKWIDGQGKPYWKDVPTVKE